MKALRRCQDAERGWARPQQKGGSEQQLTLCKVGLSGVRQNALQGRESAAIAQLQFTCGQGKGSHCRSFYLFLCGSKWGSLSQKGLLQPVLPLQLLSGADIPPQGKQDLHFGVDEH